MAATPVAAVAESPIVWEDCMQDFNTEMEKLGKWEMRIHQHVRKSDFISVLEICEVKTDPMYGWENHKTLKGVKAAGTIPDTGKFSTAETLAIMDDLFTKTVLMLDGRGLYAGPFTCALLFDVNGLVGGNAALKAFCNGILIVTGRIFAIFGSSQVTEPEENPTMAAETLATVQAVDPELAVQEIDAMMIDATLDADIRNRLSTLQGTLQVLSGSLFVAGTPQNTAAQVRAAEVKEEYKVGLFAAREAAAPELPAGCYLKDVPFWISSPLSPSSPPAHDRAGALALFMDFMTTISEFGAKLAPATSFYDIVARVNKLLLKPHLVGLRPILAMYVLGDNPMASMLGGKGAPDRLLSMLDEEFGAPLYRKVLESKKGEGAAAMEVAHYFMARNGITKSAQDVCNEVVTRTHQWVIEMSTFFIQYVLAAMSQRGRFHRQIQNHIPAVGRFYIQTWDLDQGIFCCRTPAGPSSDMGDPTIRQYTHMSGVLTSVIVELLCELMERTVLLTIELNLSHAVERPALAFYMYILTNARIDGITQINVTKERAAIPERKVNKRTGVPAAAPALTSRHAGSLDRARTSRADIARLLYDASFMIEASLKKAGILEDVVLPAECLISAEDMFDHRFDCFSRVRHPAVPGFSGFEERAEAVGAHPLHMMLTLVANIADNVASAARGGLAAPGFPENPYSDVIQGYFKSGLALKLHTITIRDILFEGEVPEEGSESQHPKNLTTEEYKAKLGSRKITMEGLYDAAIMVPVLTK